MKKVFVVKDFAASLDGRFKHLLTIAYRRKHLLYLSNLDLPTGAVVRHDVEGQRIIIEIPLKENEFLAIGDAEGQAEKRVIE